MDILGESKVFLMESNFFVLSKHHTYSLLSLTPLNTTKAAVEIIKTKTVF